MSNAPEHSTWNSVWLGLPNGGTAGEDGWYPVQGEVKVSQLAVFEPKVTIGDSSRDSDSFISTWIQGDWSGGGQIERVTGSDVNRFWWGTADTRYPNLTALPPLVESKKPSGVTSAITHPLGDLWNTANGTVSPVHGFAFSTAVYGYNLNSESWVGPAATALTAWPTDKPVVFKGIGADPLSYVPMGASGYATVAYNHSTTTITVTNVAGSSSAYPNGKPKAVSFCVFNTAMYAIDTDGYLWKQVGDQVWDKAEDFQQGRARIDPARTPRHLVSFYNKSGDPTLHIVTDQDVWSYDDTLGRLNLTALQFPPHPDFGLAAAVFRPGEDLWISSGPEVVRYTSANVIVPLSGLSRDDGVPFQAQGRFVDLQSELQCLYGLVTSYGTKPSKPSGAIEQLPTVSGVADAEATAASYSTTSDYAALVAWTGTGWHGLWESDSAVPTWMSVSKAGNEYRLFWGSTRDGYARMIRLDRNFLSPRQGIVAGNRYFANTAYLETGRFDAGMMGFDKIASALTVYMERASGADAYVTIKYRTDASLPAGSWTTLGSVTAVGKTTLQFNPDGDTFAEGIGFNWIQFRFEFWRGSDTNLTPILDSFVLHFMKVPQNTTSFAFNMPMSQDRWHGRTGNEMVDALNDALVSRKLLVFIHNKKQYRVRVAGVAGGDAPGADRSGTRQVSLIAIGTTT